MEENPIQIRTLKSGIKLLHIATDSPVSHLALMADAGSRDEPRNKHGLAHYLEHCLFKGTGKRNAYRVISRLEDVGGDLNAYTSKEEICIHASFLNEHLNRAAELLTDIAFNSQFPEKETEREKEVIIDEINAYREIPAEMIFEEIESLVFGNHPLGRTILGTPESVRTLEQKDLTDYVNNYFSPGRTIIGYSGNLRADRTAEIIEKHLTPFNSLIAQRPDIPRTTSPLSGAPGRIEQETPNTVQSHLMVAAKGYALADAGNIPLSLINNLLGGNAMSARLNLSLREKYGLAYSVESFYNAYTDTGIAGIYVATEKDSSEKCLKIVERELKRLQEERLGTLQLSKVKKQITAQMAFTRENNLNMLLSHAKSLLCLGKTETINELAAKVEAVTSSQILETANEVFAPQKLTTLIYSPR